MYLTFEEYQQNGGTLSATTFDNFEFEAEALINYRTFNRLKNVEVVPDAVKRLTKYLIDLAQKKADSLSLGNAGDTTTSNAGSYIKSQSNDGVSITYGGMSSTDLYRVCSAEANQAIDRYLVDVTDALGRKLLYRGLYPGE
jgi:hypothetical protein